MIRRLAAILLSALVMGAVVAGPAHAGRSKPDTPSPTVPSVGNDTPLGDDRLVDGEAAEVADGFGTARSHVTGVQFLAPDLDLRVIDSDTMATLDHTRAGVDANQARGYFAATSLVLGNDTTGRTVTQLGLPNTVPYPAYEAQTRGGEHTEQFQEFPVLLPETDTPIGSVDWGEGAGDVSELASWLCSKAVPNCEVGGVQPLNGDNALGFGRGDFVEGLFQPGRVQSVMGDSDVKATANSSLEELIMLSGLSILQNAGLGDLKSTVTADAASSTTKGLKMQSLDVLRLEALLDLLGLRPEQIPDPVLATMADALGINAVSLAKDAKGVNSVEALYDSLWAIEADVSDQLVNGLTCETLDPARLAAWAGTAADLGLTAPDCLGLGGLQPFLDSLRQLQSGVLDALHEAMNDAALLRMEDLWASAGANAEVGPDGRPAFGHGIKGGISTILVGSAPLTGLDLRDHADDWNANEVIVNNKLNEVLTILGPEFADLVRLRLVPEWIEEHDVEEHDGAEYATARSRLVVARVLVDTPDIDPAAVLARLQAQATDATAGALEDLVGGLPGALDGADDKLDDELDDKLDDNLGNVSAVEQLAAASSSGGGGAAPGILGQVVPGQSLTITVGEFEAEAEHTRPSVDVDCQGSCDSSVYLTRVFDPDAGRFTPALGGGDPDGNLPRTGGPGTWPIGLASALTGSAWLLVRLNRRAAPLDLH